MKIVSAIRKSCFVFLFFFLISIDAIGAVFADGFEGGIWQHETVGNFSLDRTTAHSGAQSLKVSGANTDQYIATSPIAVSPYNVWRVSVWVKSDLNSSAPAISLNVLQTSAQSQAISWYPQGQYKLIQTGGRQNWTRYSATLDRMDPATVAVKLYLRLDAGAAGNVWFDDVSLDTVNQVGYPGFETALWPYGSGGFSRDSSIRHSGVFSARVNAGDAEKYLSTDLIPIKPEETYNLSLWIKTNSVSAPEGISVNVLQVDAANNAKGWYNAGAGYKLIRTGGTKDWQQYRLTLDGFSAGTAYLKVYLRSDARIGGSAWFDDVILTQAYRDGFLWGVNGHADTTNSYVYPRNQLDLQMSKAAALGSGIYRINLSPYYNAASQTYDWSYLDEVVNTAYDKGMKIMLVLYDGLGGEYDTAYYWNRGRDLALRYKGKIAYYQMGNELDIACILGSQYDGSAFWMYNADKYATLRNRLKALSEGLHAGDPYVKRVVNIGWMHTGFLEQLNADGVQWEVNALDWYWDMGNMMTVLNKMQTYPQQEILIAETNINDGTMAVTEKQQADYIVQTAKKIYYQAPSKVKGFIVYELFDETLANPDSQAHYGLIYYELGNPGSPGAEKEAYGAYRAAIQRKP